jgi:hypothetical protein
VGAEPPVTERSRWVLPIVCAIFLVGFLGAVFGVALAKLQFWPWRHVDEMLEAGKSLRQFGAIIPEGRRMRPPEQALRERFTVHDPARMQGGYYAFAGWDDAGGNYAAWLYDASGKPLHRWTLDYRLLDSRDLPEAEDSAPHGFVVLPDGSVVVNFDKGFAMGRFDACGQPVWKREGVFHHLISQAEDGNLWSWRGDEATAYGHYQYMEKFDVATGAEIRTIGLIEDVLPADPQAAVLLGVEAGAEFSKHDGVARRHRSVDVFHPNDVEELGPALAPRFPMFAAGDLLVSIRRMNLVAVLDGTDFHFKWWSHGPWISQHDPDFTADGFISVYDNNTDRGPSAIIRMDPATRAVTELPAAAEAAWRSPYMGAHQYLPNGNVLIVSPGEGRAIERSRAGDMVMEFNNIPTQGSEFNDHVENGVWLPDGYFPTLPACGRRSP